MAMTGGVQGPKNPQITNHAAKSKESFQEMKTQAKEMVVELKQLMADTETIKQTDVGEKLGTLGAQGKDKADKAEKKQDLKRAGETDASEAAAASQSDDVKEAEKKKRKKRKKFKDKLEGFKELIDEVDIEHLNDDQQKEFKLFQKNEKELGRLFRRIEDLDTQIEEEERKLEYSQSQGKGSDGDKDNDGEPG